MVIRKSLGKLSAVGVSFRSVAILWWDLMGLKARPAQLFTQAHKPREQASRLLPRSSVLKGATQWDTRTRSLLTWADLNSVAFPEASTVAFGCCFPARCLGIEMPSSAGTQWKISEQGRAPTVIQEAIDNTAFLSTCFQWRETLSLQSFALCSPFPDLIFITLCSCFPYTVLPSRVLA